MGINFEYYDGLQPKMSAGMIKLHECRGPIKGPANAGLCIQTGVQPSLSLQCSAINAVIDMQFSR